MTIGDRTFFHDFQKSFIWKKTFPNKKILFHIRKHMKEKIEMGKAEERNLIEMGKTEERNLSNSIFCVTIQLNNNKKASQLTDNL